MVGPLDMVFIVVEWINKLYKDSGSFQHQTTGFGQSDPYMHYRVEPDCVKSLSQILPICTIQLYIIDFTFSDDSKHGKPSNIGLILQFVCF